MWRVYNKLRVLNQKGAFLPASRKFNDFINISEEVKYALEMKKPIVALESTIITHGMPYPNNYNCAAEVEAIVRKGGCSPATIAIMDGTIKIGLNPTELMQLSDTTNNKNATIKVSRRDISYALANKCNGGTTVAGTLIIASEIGIPVFATGGIGGVHREGEQTFDISADLTELGRSPVAVISSGIKSILDIPKTLEYLETQGVFVATFGKNKAFPAFYCRRSDCESPYNVDNAKDAADIIKSHLKLGLRSGLLFAVPVPKEFAMNEEEMKAVIERAMVGAKKCGVSGKQITPYLLQHIAELTKGSSLKTNIALIKNNARVAAEIAVELAKGQQAFKRITNTFKDLGTIEKQPVVIGGSNVDCCAKLKGPEITLDGRIYDAKYKINAGGVGRNIAEALAKLGCQPTFISAVGSDAYGDFLVSSLPSNCVQNITKMNNFNTAQCTVVFDSEGECRILIGDMEIHKEITPQLITRSEDLMRKSSMIVLDGNLSTSAMETALGLANQHNIPVFYEPTDVPIAGKPFTTPFWKSIKYISPNLKELKKVAETLDILVNQNSASKIEEAAAIAKLVANYIPNVIVTLGDDGLLMVRKGSPAEAFFDCNTENDYKPIEVRYYSVKKVNDLINVSGAGDCLASGIITGMLAGLNEMRCVSIGFAAAQAALYSESAVPKVLFDKSHSSWLQERKYSKL